MPTEKQFLMMGLSNVFEKVAFKICKDGPSPDNVKCTLELGLTLHRELATKSI